MIFIWYPNDFWHKRKIDNFDPYNVLLAIATNIPVLLMTAFVVQGHICAIKDFVVNVLTLMGPSLMICPSLEMFSYSWIAARRYRSSSGLEAWGSRPNVPYRRQDIYLVPYKVKMTLKYTTKAREDKE